MKKVFVISVILLFVLPGWSQNGSSSQQINIKYKNGNNVQIDAKDIDYIEFIETTSPDTPPTPVPTPVPTPDPTPVPTPVPSSPENLTNKYLIQISLAKGMGEVFLSKIYSYDSNNRISKIEAISHVANISADSYAYSYGDNSIEVNGITYNIQNGHITSTSNGVTFTYDNDGYITSASKNGNIITYTWSGGNLSYISYKRSSGTEEIESVSYEYTDLTYPQKFPYSPETIDYSHEEIMGFPPLLGYWGKTPKNLPKKYVRKSRGSVRESYNYDYTMQDGYPSIIKYTDSDGNVRTATCQWSGSASASIEGTWYMKSVKGFYYYPADGKFEPHNSNKNPDMEYDDYSNNVVMTVTTNGENIITKWKGDGYSQTLVFEKIGLNEYLCTESNTVYNRIVMKTMSDKQLVFDWYDAYYKDAKGTKKDKDHFYVAQYSFMR